MMCVDANQDGKVDFHEFTDRFHNPAKDIGFTTALLLTNLSEHMPNDPRYVWHFNPFSASSYPPSNYFSKIHYAKVFEAIIEGTKIHVQK